MSIPDPHTPNKMFLWFTAIGIVSPDFAPETFNFLRLNDNEIGLCFFKGGVLCFRPCTWDFETFLMQDTQLILNCVTLSYIILSYLTVNNVEFQPCNETLYFCEEFDHQGALKKGLSHTP